jgi:hypothetical protein
MKNVIRIILLSAVLCFANCSLSKAQVTVDYYVQIIDSCSGSYTGLYCLSATCGRVGGSPFCAYGVNCSYKNISNPIHLQYSCYDWPDCVANATYYVTASACRQSSCSGCNGTSSPPAYTTTCTDLQNGSLTCNVVIH